MNKTGYSKESNKKVRDYILSYYGGNAANENEAILSFYNQVLYEADNRFSAYETINRMMNMSLVDYYENEYNFLVSLGYPKAHKNGKPFTDEEIHSKWTSVLTREGLKLFEKGQKLVS